MAEENGKLIIKAPKDLLHKIAKLKGNDVTEVLSELFDYAGIESKIYTRETYRFDKAIVVNEYLLIEYDESCCEWSYVANAIIQKGEAVELYAHMCNEYGLNLYYSLNKMGEKNKIVVDYECDDINETLSEIELGSWVASLPSALTSDFPDFNPLDKADYILPEDAKKLNYQSWIETDLFCYFTSPVDEDFIRNNLPEEFQEFHFEDNSEYSIAEWLPLSTKDKDTPFKVLKKLSMFNETTFYANEFYEGSSHPYKLYKVSQGKVELILNSDNYKRAELNFLTDEKDEELGFNANWFSFDFNELIQIHEKYGLANYATKRLQAFHDMQKAEVNLHEEIWKKHPEEIISKLKNIRFYLYYRGMDFQKVEELSQTLILKGMFKHVIDSGLGYNGKNTLVGPDKLISALEFLKNNVPLFSEYSVVIDNDCDNEFDAVVINSY